MAAKSKFKKVSETSKGKFKSISERASSRTGSGEFKPVRSSRAGNTYSGYKRQMGLRNKSTALSLTQWIKAGKPAG